MTIFHPVRFHVSSLINPRSGAQLATVLSNLPGILREMMSRSRPATPKRETITKTKKGPQNREPWVKVYETFGPLDAELVVGRLVAEGIPARAWAESAGRAIGITVGKLGTAYVEVPAPFADHAREIIATDFSEIDPEDTDGLD